jgi:hypothetical protein
MTAQQRYEWLSKILLPNGRAFRVPDGGDLDKLIKSISVVRAKRYDDAVQILNDILPDNPNFTEDDAHDWYRRLGIYDSGAVPFADMKLAIAQKQSFPITPLNKQSPEYIEQQLQAAGFDIKVYKNRFPDGMGSWITKSPSEVLGTAVELANLGGFNLGTANLGSQWGDYNITVAANYLEEEKDALFDFGNNLRFTYYIAGTPITTFANVLASRKIEFRQLILKLKAAHMAAILFVNYV